MCSTRARIAIDNRVDNEIQRAAKNRRSLNDFEDVVNYFLRDNKIEYSYLVENGILSVKVYKKDFHLIEKSIKENRPNLRIKNTEEKSDAYLIVLSHDEYQFL